MQSILYFKHYKAVTYQKMLLFSTHPTELKMATLQCPQQCDVPNSTTLDQSGQKLFRIPILVGQNSAMDPPAKPDFPCRNEGLIPRTVWYRPISHICGRQEINMLLARFVPISQKFQYTPKNIIYYNITITIL